MTYKVLSLKWRPNSFNDVVGQDHITHTLVNAIKLIYSSDETLNRKIITDKLKKNFINSSIIGEVSDIRIEFIENYCRYLLCD